MEYIDEVSKESIEKLTPKKIVHNKLNKLILACRAEIEDNFQQDCPFCHGKNPRCDYFKPFFEDRESTAPTLVESGPEEKFILDLEEIRQTLAGQIIPVKAGLIEYDLDLGADLRIAKRYLDLYSPYPELPVLSAIGGRLGFYPSPDEEKTQGSLQHLIQFPSILIRSEKIDFSELAPESRAEIINWFRAVLNGLDQTEAGELYLGLDIIPLDPADDVGGNTDSGNSGDKRGYFAEILDLRSYWKLEKAIYQRLSDIEERILVQWETRKPEDEYPCSDLHRIHDDLRRELGEIAETVRDKVGL